MSAVPLDNANGQRLNEIERQMATPAFWSDKLAAQKLIEEHKRLKQEITGHGEYDGKDAVVTIFSGAGGDDAEDFSRLLYEMYGKFADRAKLSTRLIHEHPNDHGGYRNITFEIVGKSLRYAPLGPYGILKGESGVHRLVRVSPFSAKKLRHTSFSLVEVLPKFEKDEGVRISPGELKVEFARSSGPGGQNVNKRETAVRIIHTPTGLSAHATSERSQERNRDKAIAILSAKLYKRQEDERRAMMKGLKISQTTEIEWGNQIRSYILHPYQLVKDHRTNVETAKVDEVFNGDLDAFIEAEKNLNN